MALDDFLENCREKGAIPLNYSRRIRYINGDVSTESFESRIHADMKSRMQRVHGRKAGKIDDVVSGFYGREVVVRTKNGYHYGELLDYDGKMLYLKGYCFSRKPMDTFVYGSESIFSEDAVVPAEGVISIAEIPLIVEEQEEAEHASVYS